MRHVRILTLDPAEPEPSSIAEGARVLRAGGLVAFPTETVYGLGANALDADAVARVFAAKGRPADDPVIVHVAAMGDLDAVASSAPAAARRLAEAFWPGPLTLVVPRAAHIPPIVAAGGDTVGVRMPAHPVALALIAAAGVPVAAPSANPFGRTSPTTAAHVVADLGDRVDLVLDGGPCAVGIESTVVDCTLDPPSVLRPGGVSVEALRAVVPRIRLGGAMDGVGENVARRDATGSQGAAGVEGGPWRSPGLAVRHYAPRARLVLVHALEADDRAASAVVAAAAERLRDVGVDVGVLGLAPGDVPEGVAAAAWVGGIGDGGAAGASQGALVRSEDPAARAAHGLYAALRDLDAAGCAIIVARDLGPAGLGLALRDRLTRAAEGRVVDVERTAADSSYLTHPSHASDTALADAVRQVVRLAGHAGAAAADPRPTEDP